MVHVNALGFKYVKIVGKIFLSDIEEYIKSHIYHPAEISFIDVRIYSLLFADLLVVVNIFQRLSIDNCR